MTGVRRFGGLLAVLTLAVALGACGGYSNGEDTEPATPEERAVIRAVVAFDVGLDPMVKELRRITATLGTPTELPGQLTELATAFRSGAQELADIDFPTDAVRSGARLKGLLAQAADLLDRYAAGMVRGDLAEFLDIAPQLTEVLEQIRPATTDLRRDLGLPTVDDYN